MKIYQCPEWGNTGEEHKKDFMYLSDKDYNELSIKKLETDVFICEIKEDNEDISSS